MNKKTKRLLTLGGLISAVFVLSGCTASFCAPADTAHMLYNEDSGLIKTVEGSETTYAYNDNLQSIITKAEAQGFAVPTETFWVRLDEEVLELATTYYSANTELSVEENNAAALKEYGHLKFLGTKDSTTTSRGTDLWGNFDLWVYDLGQELGIENVPTADFNSLYKAELTTKVGRYRACIALDEGQYGPEGEKITVTAKDWGYAFSRGPIEGLLVYPIAAFVEVLTTSFGAGGIGQVWAILIVTVTVRSLMILVTLKSTVSQQKMQALQPELAKIQQKYPNSNTNQSEKQGLANAQMALYKKNNINPLSSILVMFVQFPIFIAVWGAMTGSASLASDSVLGLNLNAQLGASMMSNWFSSSWWTAAGLFLLMAVAQFIATRITQWLTKKRVKKDVVKTTVNPAADKQQSQMKMMTWFMFIMILVMSWSLPAAMGIYWLVGALISIAQAVITHAVLEKKRTKK
ncbi:MAG TPA: YidC/Oxa1 family membrane protein insertase [Bacilli bacterium]|nr:YidC/Oxa1 family membrane protein insertase [Bacilli bacterium]